MPGKMMRRTKGVGRWLLKSKLGESSLRLGMFQFVGAGKDIQVHGLFFQDGVAVYINPFRHESSFTGPGQTDDNELLLDPSTMALWVL